MAPREGDSVDSAFVGPDGVPGVNVENSQEQLQVVEPIDDDAASIPSTISGGSALNGDSRSRDDASISEQVDMKAAARSLARLAMAQAIQRSSVGMTIPTDANDTNNTVAYLAMQEAIQRSNADMRFATNPKDTETTAKSAAMDQAKNLSNSDDGTVPDNVNCERLRPPECMVRRRSTLSDPTRSNSKVSAAGERRSSGKVESGDNGPDGDAGSVTDGDVEEGWSCIHADDISIAHSDGPGAYRVGVIDRRGSEDGVSIVVGTLDDDDEDRRPEDNDSAGSEAFVIPDRTQADDEASLLQWVEGLDLGQRLLSRVAASFVNTYIDTDSLEGGTGNQNENEKFNAPDGTKRRHGWLQICICFVLSFTAIGGIGVGILLFKTSPSGGAVADVWPTASPNHFAPTRIPTAYSTNAPTTTQAPTTNRLQHLKDLLISNNATDPMLLSNTSSPQFRAMEWLANSPTDTNSLTAVDRTIERFVLALLFYTLNGSEWKRSQSWLSDENACNWETVTCSHEGKNVAGISVDDNGLSYSIPTEIGMLSKLKYLSMSNNTLEGSLPPTFGQLTELRVLSLGWNHLRGTLPSIGALSNLEVFNIEGNDFEDNLNAQFCKAASDNTEVDDETFPRLMFFAADCFDDDPKVVCDCMGYCSADLHIKHHDCNTDHTCD